MWRTWQCTDEINTTYYKFGQPIFITYAQDDLIQTLMSAFHVALANCGVETPSTTGQAGKMGDLGTVSVIGGNLDTFDLVLNHANLYYPAAS